jgi:tetratricopeptide (TPR) repeat protein/serine/threonine protein kinase
MASSASNSELVMELAEEFLERYRKGERPPLKEYIDRHPELAAEIKEVFPAMAMMENIAVADESVAAKAQESGARGQEKLARQQLGDFRLIREIGHGGMGVVYEAEQVSLGRHVALKVLLNQALLDPKQKRRFEREARAAAKLHHTNIVPVFGVGEHDGLPYYVMQFIQGLGLDAVLDELNHMQPGAAHTPTGLPTAGEIRIARRDISAADVACSLMTGQFQQPDAGDEADEPKPRPVVAATKNQTVQQGTRGERPAARADGSNLASPSSLASPSGQLSDSFTVSSSSITLAGSSGTGHKTAARKPTYWHSVANIGRQVADALEYAHKQGVLHRDVKPSNLLLDLRGTAWVTDFGLAKVAGPGAAAGDNITHTGDILGTLRYMPPEAFEGKSDARSDVYSLGLTLYELLALRPAFDETDRNKLIKQVTTGEPAALDKVSREAPRDLVTIVHKAIDREPSRRYATAEDFASDLQRFLDDEPILARRQTHLERYVRWARHNPGIAVLGGVLTAVLVLVTLGSLLVAGRMSTLAEKETQAAADERTARQEAENAKNREARQRTQAELAKREADESRQRAEGALQKAEENFARARAAVNDYLTAVSEDERLKAPGLQGLRIQLLQSALQFYQQFLKERGNDPTLRRELAGVYYKVGEIYRDLGQRAASNQSYARARRLYESLAAESPGDPDLQHGLAMTLRWTGAQAQATLILEKLINPQDPRYHADLGLVYNDEAIRFGKADKANKGIPDKAKELEFLRKALTVRERLVRLKPDDPDARLGLSASLNNIAVRLQADRNAEALALLQRAAEQCETAYRLRPADSLTAKFLTIQLNNIANKAKLAGETELILAAHRRRVEVLDRRARDNPTIPGFGADLVAGYGRLLTELREAGRWDEATRVADKARVRIAETAEETTEFTRQVSYFHLTAYAFALARAKAAPDGKTNTEPEAAAAVNALRQHVLSGWHHEKWMRTDALTEPLRQRADFKELLARMDELDPAYTVALQTTATPEEKLAARQQILTTLEALAGPLPSARFVRRILAQARQDLAQALLGAGQVEEARLAFDEALAAREQLVQESPSNEQLRADLTQSQSAAGDLFAAAGKLADAVKTWDRALATLEEGLKTNPNSIPFQTALSERLTHLGFQYGNFGMWTEAARCYRRAFQIQTPTGFPSWYRYGVLLVQAADEKGYRSLADKAVSRPGGLEGVDGINLSRILLASPSSGERHPKALRRIAEQFQAQEPFWQQWIRGFAFVRIGQAQASLDLLEKSEVAWAPVRQCARALAEHQLGHRQAAVQALREADLAAERLMHERAAADMLRLTQWWDDWLLAELLRHEAHQKIHGKPMPESPYARLFRGRVLSALDEPDKAEAEFVAAVAMRPNDADVWLTRSRIFAKLGRKDRMAADLLRAQQLKGDDPRTWIETGRLLAERGEPKQADIAFARAFALGKGELNRFLESGWWLVGPYPERMEMRCPPEINPDPSKPVAAIDQNRELKWQTVPTTQHRANIQLPNSMGGQAKASSYALNYVHADRDRTAVLHLWPKYDARVWLNGRLVFGGFGEGKKAGIIEIPVTLRKGRNTLLVKNRHDNGAFCECAFLDAPVRRGYELVRMGLWAEAGAAFAEADRRSPLHEYPSRLRIHTLLATGRDQEARQVFAELVRRHGRAGNLESSQADFLPPNKTGDRERWLAAARKFAETLPAQTYRYHRLANACFRAGQFGEAEKNVRQAIAGNDQLYFWPLLACSLHRLGKSDEARKTLQQMEERHARLVKEALAANPYRPAQVWEEELWYQATLREARTLILGRDPGASADEKALLLKAHAWLAELENAEDDYARLVMKHPDQPRLWIALGRHHGERKRWDEAAKAFARAVELAPKDRHIWKERGRAYADLGKWDEAVADLCKALDLTPEPRPNFPDYPWQAGRGEADELIAGSAELFERVTKARPKDATVSVRRVEHLASAGRWAEAEAALRNHVRQFPDDWRAPCLLSRLLLLKGDLEGYRHICRAALDQFAGGTDYYHLIMVARAALVGRAGLQDDPLITKLLADADKQTTLEFWMQATAALAEYRRGDGVAALKRLDSRVTAWPHGPFTQATADAVRALACQQVGRTADARAALARARDGLARHRPHPDRGWFYDWDWHNWVQVEILVREAESVLPAAPATAEAPGASPAQEENARRDRKARAESISTQAALAQIRFDVGQKKEAEAELRVVLAQLGKIAAEEPGNADYQVDLAATRLRFGRFLADSGRLDEALKESEEALVFLERLAAQLPKNLRLRAEIASGGQSIGDLYAKANRPADALQAWQKAIEFLSAALKENPDNRVVGAALATAEEKLGNHYGSLTLWTEAGELLARAVRRPGGGANAWRWLRAGQASLAAGNVAEVSKLAAEAFARFRMVTNSNQLTALVELMALTDSPKESLSHLIPLAEQTARDRPQDLYLGILMGIYEYRAGQFEQALQRLESPRFRGQVWSTAFLAMGHYRLGHVPEARQWLGRAEKSYTSGLRKRVEQAAPGVGPIWWNTVNQLTFYREAHELISGKPMPLDPLERLCRARAYLHLGEPAKAEAELEAAIESHPEDPTIWLARSRIFTKLGRPADAAADRARVLQLAEQALTRRPEDSAVADALASLLLDKVDPKWTARRAVDLLTKATAANPKPRPATWLVLALAHARLAEIDQAKNACSKAAALLKPSGADPALRPLLREVLLVLGTNHPEAKELIAAAAGEPPAALTKVIQQNPDKAKGYRDRGNWYAERGRWQEAIADFAELFRIEPGTFDAMKLGILLVQAGELDRYRDHCRAIRARWRSTNTNWQADQAMKTCLLHPGAMMDVKELAQLAERAVAGDKKQALYAWFLVGRGLYDLRAGHFADALAACRESRRRAPETKSDARALTALNLVIEAMALHRSGDEAGAKSTLAEARSHLDLHVPGIDGAGNWHDWLAAHLLYREAEGLIAGNKAELPK